MTEKGSLIAISEPNINPVPKTRKEIWKRRSKIIKEEEFENGNKEEVRSIINKAINKIQDNEMSYNK